MTDTPQQRGDVVATFLRFVQRNCNDVAPETILGPDAEQSDREKIRTFARSLHEEGLIEPTIRPGMGPDGGLLMVRVTAEGEDYLAQHSN